MIELSLIIVNVQAHPGVMVARTRRIDRDLPPGPTITFAGDLITESHLTPTDAL